MLAFQMTDISAQSSSHILTQQEKLDAVFGITNGQDLDTFLGGLSLDQAIEKNDEALSAINELSVVEQEMQVKMEELKGMSSSMALPQSQLQLQMESTEHSLKELEEMVSLSKDIIKHVHASILATPLIDSEAVQAFGKLVESIHISIAEFIGVYRDKQNFINKVKYAVFDKEIKKELLRYKADLQKELILAKEGPKNIDADAIETNNRAWNVDQVNKIIDAQNGK